MDGGRCSALGKCVCVCKLHGDSDRHSHSYLLSIFFWVVAAPHPFVYSTVYVWCFLIAIIQQLICGEMGIISLSRPARGDYPVILFYIDIYIVWCFPVFFFFLLLFFLCWAVCLCSWLFICACVFTYKQIVVSATCSFYHRVRSFISCYGIHCLHFIVN